jgi:hypothetical protein
MNYVGGSADMTVDSLIAHLQRLVDHCLNKNAIVKAWDPDAGEIRPVTGFLYDDNEVELCTSEED